VSRDQRNAKRMLLAIEAKGGRFVLIGWDRFGICNFWLPRRLRRKIERLQPYMLKELQAAALKMMEQEAALGVKPEAKPTLQPTVN
jgi:hypothetical protein